MSEQTVPFIATDLHTHILPHTDDGSHSAKESLLMLRMEQAQGVRRIVATPHFYADRDTPSNFLERRDAAVRRLAQALAEAGEPDPQLALGAEVLFFSGIAKSENLESFLFPGTRYLLLEMPFEPWTFRMLDEIRAIHDFRGIIPIIAHLDRYIRLAPREFVEELMNMNVLIQTNASFFYDWQTRGKAMRLLEEGQIHFLGSDCHDLGKRSPDLHRAAKYIARKDEEELEQFNSRSDSLLRDLQCVDWNSYRETEVPVSRTSFL